MDKYQPGLFVTLRSTSPVLPNDKVKLDHYIGNNEWMIVDSNNDKHRLKEKWFHDIARINREGC